MDDSQIIADLQIHSKYSRAVSKNMVLPEIRGWARKKGIGLMATGDWMHPLWFRELSSQLEEVSSGIYRLKREYLSDGGEQSIGDEDSSIRHNEPLFLLSAEISSIYTQGGKQRRVHTLVFAPNFSAAQKINLELVRRGCNLSSDGRPIVGLSAKEIAEISLSTDERCLVIPAHAWTPWFSLYGSKSGFDSIAECFGDTAANIYAVETGLSSDPAMNWRIGELRQRAVVSFSDAHSGPKLGREATIFQFRHKQSANSQVQSFTYDDVYQAIAERYLGKNQGKLQISSTIEFNPEEGKYHYTGHRTCGVVQSPEETRQRGTTCHVCGKPLTLGVMHRVEELSQRVNGQSNSQAIQPIKKTSKAGVVGYYHPSDAKRPPYVMMVPLMEILGEVHHTGSGSKTVQNEYNTLISQFGSEFAVLLHTPLAELASFGGERLGDALQRVRNGSISIKPGYDGVFGTVRIWPESDQLQEGKEQMSLF
ncbi:MAG: hypothetical protein A3A65_03400 [Candidatus Chisholmbacteria bacterium RIFCSPLOWO2_01_FULL_49_14]|uniref:DNA helicase UvrD n=1 Tax=Candidatus Chisholmbacteria bacterium RIFCSPLOWO2_01_FULL_49_14 TaxID=1797593 RepID=A0A1G1W1A7_9BACT|nr:MAG: hypothetical protein A3A65_03400 [Candidatus Chisholmbacteria bacterium RIFCSPLOWO2_01_FULL_49_14]